jgi:hypothetical protein
MFGEVAGHHRVRDQQPLCARTLVGCAQGENKGEQPKSRFNYTYSASTGMLAPRKYLAIYFQLCTTRFHYLIDCMGNTR